MTKAAFTQTRVWVRHCLGNRHVF